jgi:hypothetical protein
MENLSRSGPTRARSELRDAMSNNRYHPYLLHFLRPSRRANLAVTEVCAYTFYYLSFF